MKRIVLLMALCGLGSYFAQAQTSIPQLVNFQAVARNASGAVMANQSVLVRLTIRQGAPAGGTVYCATHQATTNAYGSFSIQLNRNALGSGCNGAPAITFENIDWASGSKWLQIEFQPPGGSFIDLGTSEMAASPFAFAARSAEQIKNVQLTGGLHGQVLKYNAQTQQWTPEDDMQGSSVTFTAGAGISLNNNIITNTGDLSTVNELQTLSIQGNQLTISNGNTVTLPGGGSGTSPWLTTGSNISNTNTGNVGIGTTTPTEKLEVLGKAKVVRNGLSTTAEGDAIYIRDAAGSLKVGLTATGSSSQMATYGVNNNQSVVMGTLSTNDGLMRVNTSAAQAGVEIAAGAGDGSISVFDNGTAVAELATTTVGGGFFGMDSPNLTANVRISSLSANTSNGFIAVYGTGTQKAGVYVDAAGLGTIFGDVKNFRMQHPTQPGKEIWYASLEGPEAAAYCRGTSSLVNGETTVTFSEHFKEVGNPYTMTVVLTPGSADSKGLAVVEKTATGFKVKELARGQGNYSFDWEVKAVRKGYENYRVLRNASEMEQTLPAKRTHK